MIILPPTGPGQPPPPFGPYAPIHGSAFWLAVLAAVMLALFYQVAPKVAGFLLVALVLVLWLRWQQSGGTVALP
jgi:hypothetical protein